MMKQFLFEQLSNSVQNTTNKLIAHSEDNKKIITILDNLINTISTSNNPPTLQIIEQDIGKISEFVSEILGTLDSCLFTLEYNTNKYVQHLQKKKDDPQNDQQYIQGNQRMNEMNTMKNNMQLVNTRQMQEYNNDYMYDQDYDDLDDDYSQQYQQMNNGFNGMDDEDDEEEIYDEGDDMYLENEIYANSQNMQGNNMAQQQQQLPLQKPPPQQYYQNQQQFQPNLNQQQHLNQLNNFVKIENIDNSHQQQNNYHQSSRNSNQSEPQTMNRTKSRSTNLTVNDIFQ